MPEYRAVIFDVGGVVVGSPLEGINLYEEARGLPFQYLNVAITALGSRGAFQRFERSEIDLWTFYDDFGKELSDTPRLNAWYTKFCEMRKWPLPALPEKVDIDGRELFGKMMAQSVNADSLVVNAIRRLRASGRFKVAALTNNFSPPTSVATNNGKGKSAPTLEEELEHLGLGQGTRAIRELFDVYIESAVVGMRKPDPKFYQYALDQLGVKAEETVFLDDIGHNLKAAKDLGITTIRVGLNDSLPALRTLEQALGLELVDEKDAAHALEQQRQRREQRKSSKL